MSDCECKHEGKIAMLEQRDQMILDSLQELKGKTDMILMQVTKVAVLEVNHDVQSKALDRAFSRIELLENGNATIMGLINQAQGGAKVLNWLVSSLGIGNLILLVKVLFFGNP